ncbi:MFS general substrate transporter, partial [Ramicandelaber brevisporus]
DGGYGWVIVAACFLALIVSFGFINSYGAYQRFYSEQMFKGRHAPSVVSFVGTLTAGMMNASGPLSGWLCDRIGARPTMAGGALIMTLGLMLASLATELWQLFLTQGLVLGMGASLIVFPAITVPSQWFDRYRGMATGIVFAGSGVGGLALSPLSQALMDSVGIHWTLRIMGFIVLGAALIAAVFVRTRIPAVRKPISRIYDLQRFKDRRFLILFASSVFGSLSYFIPFYYLPTHSTRLGYTATQASALLSAMNGGSVAGRILGGFVADRFGRVNTLAVSLLISTLSVLILWLPFTQLGVFYVFAVVYGLSCGGFISTLPVVIADIWGLQGLASIVGLAYLGYAVGSIAGSPIAGAILD